MTQGEVGHDLTDLHDLFLVDNNPVGRLQDLCQSGVEGIHTFLAMLTGNEVADLLHGTWPVEGVDRHNLLKRIRMDLAQHLADALRFKLKDPQGLTLLEKPQGLRVGLVKGLRIQILLLVNLNQVQDFVQQLQVS